MSSAPVVELPTGDEPRGNAPVRSPAGSRPRRNLLIALTFLAPALILLGAILVYPVVFTAGRSVYDASGSGFVGWDNYVTMFTNDSTFTAIRNNVIWVVVAPVACTVIGLVFAVLLDKISWATAFKLIIFMPMAISMLAAGVIFRGMFQESPQLGVVNAAIVGVSDFFGGDGASFPGATPRGDAGIGLDHGIISTDDAVATGSQADFPLVGIRGDNLPESATQATASLSASADEISGTVWLDVVPGGGGINGEIDPGEVGLSGVRVDAVTSDGAIAASTVTDVSGAYSFSSLDPGSYRIALPAKNFDVGFQGVSWLSSSFITSVVILSYVWIWAGFAMVMIASGLSAIDRSLQEAARMDGANEWQVFSRITVPLLYSVILVVFVTLIVNVLKIFDLVYVIPPGASKPAANVIAVEMWRVSFGGGNHQGVGSALAILLLILVLPSMIFNIRRFKQDKER